jgi:hypothetical protein
MRKTLKLSGDPEMLRAVLRDKFGMTDADIDRELEKELQKRKTASKPYLFCIFDPAVRCTEGNPEIECQYPSKALCDADKELEEPKEPEFPANETPRCMVCGREIYRNHEMQWQHYSDGVPHDAVPWKAPKDELDPNAQQATLTKEGWIHAEKPAIEPKRCRVCSEPIFFMDDGKGYWTHSGPDDKHKHQAIPVEQQKEPPKSKFNKGDSGYYIGDKHEKGFSAYIYDKKWDAKKGMWWYDTSLPGRIYEHELQKEDPTPAPKQMGGTVANCETHGGENHLG